ncbi:YwpF-like family protein [Lederbergia citrea]|uniref:YwpF-like family protein n=1 Tax=Lederbergia citrea TaxID=2833581 RepID=A0A942UL45_9BACI|nr:YwpF-like family protein [Lederbergia citrea]MBS4178081.1 YwpF-like family protein [Lederbergia citrea]MBS4204747.1 YwpF-like family protein [Lederbergia citrea]MBS4223405.1 YwpF-like family protein [Lederbergia citrea]
MKTFKIVALQMLKEHKAENIPLTDGLIINKENEDGFWIIEAFIDEKYEELFQKKYDSKEIFEIRVIITHAANDPAPFTVKVHTIKRVDHRISVLFEGRLSKRRNDYSELLLDDLIKEGFSGEKLIEEFKRRMKTKQKV